jgi:hypothetical protein
MTKIPDAQVTLPRNSVSSVSDGDMILWAKISEIELVV